MEILFEFVAEIFASLASVAVGAVLGSVAMVAMVGLRRAQARVARSSEVTDPAGDPWSVRVVFGVGRRWSTRFGGMSNGARRRRRRAGLHDHAVEGDEIWHPRQLLDAHDEAAGCVAPFLVLGAVAIAILVVIELLVALPIALVVLALSAARGRWQVEVVDPHDQRSILDESSLADARATAQHVTERIRAGLPFEGRTPRVRY